MSFLKTLMTVNVTSDAKKAVGIHEIKKKILRIYKNNAAPILQFSLFFSEGVFGLVFFH